MKMKYSPLGCVLSLGPVTHSPKNKITEMGGVQNSSHFDEATRAHSNKIKHLGQSRKETIIPTVSIVNLGGSPGRMLAGGGSKFV